MELEVEPVDRIEDVDDVAAPPPDGPTFILYGGKGGVGKSTMAAATGLSLAAAGRRTLVISTDPAHSLADSYRTTIGATPTRIAESIPLYAVELDPATATGDIDWPPDAGLFDELFDTTGMADLRGDPGPGTDEVLAMWQLLRYVDDDRFDAVVIDTAPTGHTLRLLELPDILDGTLGRLLQLQERFQGAMTGITGWIPGVDDTETPDSTVSIDELRDRIDRLRTVLTDPDRTDFRVVMVPESMSVRESERLIQRLEAAAIPVSTIVVNRVMEPVDRIIDDVPDDIEMPDLEGCRFCRRRWSVQRDALGDAHILFGGRTVKRVPLFAADVGGIAMLRIVARCLA